MTQTTAKTSTKATQPKRPSTPPAAVKVTRQPTHEEISDRARAMWESRGRPAGSDVEIWLAAESELRSRP